MMFVRCKCGVRFIAFILFCAFCTTTFMPFSVFANEQYPELGNFPLESDIKIYDADSCIFYMPGGSIRGAYQSNYFYYAAAPNASPAYTTGLDMTCNGVAGGYDNNNKVYNLTMNFQLLLNGSYYTSDVQNNLTLAYKVGEVGHVFASKKLGVGSISLTKVTDQGSDGVMIFNVSVTTDKVIDLTYPIVVSLSSSNQNIGGLTGKNTFFGMARNFSARGVINGDPNVVTNDKLGDILNSINQGNSTLNGVKDSVDNIYNSIQNGDSESNAVSGELDSATNDFNSSSGQYDEFEQSQSNDFTSNFGALDNDVKGFSLTSLTAATTWFTSLFMSIYNLMGDYKMYVTAPLILGLALFFIGRGAVIFSKGGDD